MAKKLTTKKLTKELKRNNISILEYINTFLDDISSLESRLDLINKIDENPCFWNEINATIVRYVEKTKKKYNF